MDPSKLKTIVAKFLIDAMTVIKCDDADDPTKELETFKPLRILQEISSFLLFRREISENKTRTYCFLVEVRYIELSQEGLIQHVYN